MRLAKENGISTGTQKTAELFNWLFLNDRIADAQKASSYPAFLSELMIEYKESKNLN